ncbi:MAG: hypothetical protein AAF986_10110 [Pseudomonadota bacterium]
MARQMVSEAEKLAATLFTDNSVSDIKICVGPNRDAGVEDVAGELNRFMSALAADSPDVVAISIVREIDG